MTDRIKQASSGKRLGREVTFTLTYGAIANGAQEVQSATVAGVAASDLVAVTPAAALAAGIAVTWCRVSAVDTIDVAIGCFALAGVTPGATTFRCEIFSLAA
jgi:hypothetical protein